MIVNLFNINGSPCFALNFLYNFPTRANNCANHVASNAELLNPRSMWLKVGTRFLNGFHHFSQNVHSAFARLLESTCHNFVRKPIDLYIHLRSSDSILSPGYLEVHVAKVILIAKDIGKNGEFTSSSFCN